MIALKLIFLTVLAVSGLLYVRRIHREEAEGLR